MEDKRDTVIVMEEGTQYALTEFAVVDGKGIQPTGQQFFLTFVRGDKEDKETVIPRVSGILHESLLTAMIKDLKYKNSLVPSRESSLALTKLQEALHWMEERQRDRKERQVQGTYNK